MLKNIKKQSQARAAACHEHVLELSTCFFSLCVVDGRNPDMEDIAFLLVTGFTSYVYIYTHLYTESTRIMNHRPSSFQDSYESH